MMWTAVLVSAVGCYLLKLAGLSVPPRILERPLVERVADLIPVALLSALVAVQVFSSGHELVLDARGDDRQRDQDHQQADDEDPVHAENLLSGGTSRDWPSLGPSRILPTGNFHANAGRARGLDRRRRWC